MEAVDAALAAIEDALPAATVTRFGIPVSTLAYDATNCFTYMATPTPSALARRGQNQQKRNDLRQVNLALLATVTDHVPLVHTTYPGNVPDPTAFGQALDRLAQRYHQLTVLTGDPITMVFDQSNVRQANMTAVWARGGRWSAPWCRATTRICWPCRGRPTLRRTPPGGRISWPTPRTGPCTAAPGAWW